MKMQRNYTVDIIRLIASFGVIAIHTHANTYAAKRVGDFFSPLCVPFFFITSLIYFISSLPHTSLKDTLSKTFFRLMLPYIAWTIIYTLLLTGKNMITHGDYHFVAWRTFFYGESAVQLYYLPDLIVMQMIALGIFTLASPLYQKKLYPALLFAGGVVFIWIGNFYHCFGLANQGLLLKFSFYLFCGFLLSAIIYNTRVKILYILSGVALLVFGIVAGFHNFTYSIMDYPVTIPFGGLGLTLLAIGAPLLTIPDWLKRLTSYSYGIYLCHILFLESFETIINKLLHTDLKYDFVTKLIAVVFIFLLSVLFTYIIRKFSLLREFLLGEKK